ncbi:MAG: hypothetical protein EOO62_33355 [Hymenobacter sp.]|nr:MAG: hypothetical protein EOO62_33355 [Hymenobacter sp.]
MVPIALDASVLDGYVRLAATLSTASKLDLIARLSASVKGDIVQRENSFAEAFGAFESAQTAEEIIDDYR